LVQKGEEQEMKKSPEIHDQLRPTLQEEEERWYGVSRIVPFSDGVFAFAITLLIISILPYADFTSSPSAEQFFQRLFSLKFHFLSYVLSFYVIGLYWQTHHRFFRYIIKFDAGLFLINLTLLLCIAFLPFPTDLLGRYGDASIIAAFYAGVLTMLSLLHLLLWWYASSHHRLIRPHLEQHLITYVRLSVLLPLPIFVISIGLAFMNPFLAEAAWVATFFAWPILTRKYRKRNEPPKL
jgi:uncharacterized membrane protein